MIQRDNRVKLFPSGHTWRFEPSQRLQRDIDIHRANVENQDEV